MARAPANPQGGADAQPGDLDRDSLARRRGLRATGGARPQALRARDLREATYTASGAPARRPGMAPDPASPLG
jgi:hypothetical protein